MATIFEMNDLKYTQTDIDVRDARIKTLEKELAAVKDELRKYKTHAKIAANSHWGSNVYTAADDWKDIMMRSNRYDN
jgi:hypothetical protein